MRRPRCPICGVALERAQDGWRCPECTFFYRVERGRVVSKPMWLAPEPGAQEAASAEDEIERYKRDYGVEFTPEGLRFMKENPERFRRIVSRGRTS